MKLDNLIIFGTLFIVVGIIVNKNYKEIKKELKENWGV